MGGDRGTVRGGRGQRPEHVRRNRFLAIMVPEVPKFVFPIFRIFFLKKNDFLNPPWPFFGATKILDHAIFDSWAIHYRK